MQYFYSGSIRRYLVQTIRVLSNFSVRYADGSLVRVPVIFGDPDRQVASIINQNSENTVATCPKIAVYITGLDIDRERTADSTFVSKLHIRERGIETDPQTGHDVYNQAQGRNYTVERLMPTPFKLTMKADIWASNTDQKLQIFEQIAVLFNPSLELQISDNYVDWTSLTVLNLTNTVWSSRTVPVGVESPIDICTLTLETPIWLSPPVKVKHLGVITKIITSLYNSADTTWSNIDGLGADPNSNGTTSMSGLLTREVTTITDYQIQVYNGEAVLLGPHESVIPREPTLEIPLRQGTPITWKSVFDVYPNQYIGGVSKLFLTQSNGMEVVGTIRLSPTDDTVLLVEWDPDSYPSDEDIVTTGDREASNRSPGTFDAIIDPSRIYPGHGMADVVSGDRFLIIEDIGSPINQDGPLAWKNTDSSDFIAEANDIIEWQTDHWAVIFDASNSNDVLLYQTNIYNGRRVQYVWNGVSWAKSFEGEYGPPNWRIEL